MNCVVSTFYGLNIGSVDRYSRLRLISLSPRFSHRIVGHVWMEGFRENDTNWTRTMNRKFVMTRNNTWFSQTIPVIPSEIFNFPQFFLEVFEFGFKLYGAVYMGLWWIVDCRFSRCVLPQLVQTHTFTDRLVYIHSGRTGLVEYSRKHAFCFPF